MKSPDKKTAPSLKKGDKIEIIVSALDDDGCGIAVHAATQIRVTGGLPGDKLLARVTYSSQHRITAERIRITIR